MSFVFQGDYLCSDAIAHHAKFSPRQIAVICDGEQRTWRDLDTRTRKVANALMRQNVKKGDKVGLFMQSSLLMFELLWGIIRSGAVAVPLNTMMARDSLARMINNSQARLLFTDAANESLVRQALPEFETISLRDVFVADEQHPSERSAERFVAAGDESPLNVRIGPSDSANIIYTSGTTGVPKGVEHSHFARLSYALGFGQWLLYERSSVTVCATPLYANGTWLTMLPAMYRGGTVVVLPKFSPEAFLDAVASKRCTHTFMVPTQYITLLEHSQTAASDTSSLRMLMSGGQALLPAVSERIRQTFPSAALYDCYGMSEGFGTMACPDDFARGKTGSVGKPFFLDDICIIDENDCEVANGVDGEIVGYSPGLMKGYYRDAERTEASIWRGKDGRTYIRSGDIGHFDEDGYLYVSGRLKDMIKSGGINVYASDIEAVFMRHPVVREAAAIGIPHDKWVETPLLFVLLREGVTISEAELRDWGNAQLGKFQRVSRIEFRDEFPRATYGKVQKAELRAPYWNSR